MQINSKDAEAHQSFIAPAQEKKLDSGDTSLSCDDCAGDCGCCACRVGHSPRCRLGPAAATILHTAVLVIVLTTSLIGTHLVWRTDVFDRFVASRMVMDLNSSAFAWFLDPPIKPIVSVYIFNYTNVEDYLKNGSKLQVEEVGPLVYIERIKRVDVVPRIDSTLDFTELKYYNLLPAASALDPNAKVQVPNLPYMSIVSQMKSLNSFLALPVSLALKSMNPKPFITVGAQDLVWGYDDNLYWAARTAAQASPVHIQDAPPNERFGLLAAKNGTGDRLSVATGALDLDQVGNVMRWNNRDTLKSWKGDCRKLEASDGGIFPPLKIRRKESIVVFKAEACRRINFEFAQVSSMYGMETHQYLIPEDEFHMSKGPKCYCEFNGCLPDGLFDTSPCSYGAPVVVSYPHFYRSDPALLEPFEGLKPNSEKHSMRIDIHSRFGLTLSGVSRLQLNMLVRSHGGHLKQIPENTALPIAWFEMYLPAFDEDYTKTLQLASKALDILEGVLLYGLPIAACCAIYALLKLYLTLRLRTVRPEPPVVLTSLPKTISA